MIFPIPKEEEYFDGSYTFKDLACASQGLLDFYKEVNSGNLDFSLKLNPEYADEEYVINISEDGIEIIYSSNQGLYRAVSSFIQLIKKQGTNLRYAHIHDWPDFKRRGYMLDISRSRMPKVETIKKIIDYISCLKYNEFQLYMESFCFKYKAFPEYTKDFECLTADDIKELEAYCNERFIDLVPNQNSFGHMTAWLSKDEFKFLGEWDGEGTPGNLNVLHEGTIPFLDKLYESLLPNFKSEYVNIGLDEAWDFGEYQTKEYCDKYGKGYVYVEYLNKLRNLIKEKYNKKVMYWADMLPAYDGIYENLPHDAIAMEWGYDLIQCQQMTEHCVEFAAKNVPFYVCPSCNTHNSFTGRTDVMLFNLRTCAELGVKHGAIGYLLTDWGDAGHPQFGVWSFVPVALGGQYAWNSGDAQVGSDFKRDFNNAAWEWVDEVYFDGEKVAKELTLLGNYYLLECERVHNNTITNVHFSRNLDTDKNPVDEYDGDTFMNDSIISYIKHHLGKIESLKIDDMLKRQIVLNCNMTILAAEFGNIRLTGTISKGKKKELIDLTQKSKDEFIKLWNMINYEKGVLDFAAKFDDKLAELKEVKEI